MLRELPSLERLQELFHYDPETGLLTRACQRPKSAAKTGDVVGTTNSDGHLICRVDVQICYVHRIVWKMHYRVEPPERLDHKNKMPADNRISNLRPATSQQNGYNRKIAKSNTSGVTGVKFSKKRPANKWKAYIKVNGRSVHLGYFTHKDDAIAARLNAEQIYCHEFAASVNPAIEG